MNPSSADIARFVLGLAALLLMAHGGGALFRKARQPAVIGEILGGLMLGPSVLGLVLPDVQRTLFGAAGTPATMLGAVSQLGLLLMMFCSGVEVRNVFPREQRLTTLCIVLAGTLLPFVAGLAIVDSMDIQRLLGGAGSRPAFVLVFAVAIAVTSIPVIARILFDLGILDTDFARIVMGAAVVEDVALYVVLGIALSIAGTSAAGAFGLPAILGLEGTSGVALGYHLVANIGFITLASTLGPRLMACLETAGRGGGVLAPLALLTICGAGLWLGVSLVYGAFVAGIVVGSRLGRAPSVDAMCEFSFVFFIPIYFAGVGASLDLVRHFEPALFFLLLFGACAIKASSVYLGARLAGESPPAARNLAVAMNARGGPGIVLASVAYEAGVIAEIFYVVLVLLAIVTSLMAGAWLDLVVRRNWALR